MSFFQKQLFWLCLILFGIGLAMFLTNRAFSGRTKDNYLNSLTYKEMAHIAAQWGWWHHERGVPLGEMLKCMIDQFEHKSNCQHAVMIEVEK